MAGESLLEDGLATVGGAGEVGGGEGFECVDHAQAVWGETAKDNVLTGAAGGIISRKILRGRHGLETELKRN